MSGPTRAGVRKQLQAMAQVFTPAGSQSLVEQAGLAGNYLSPLMLRSAMGYGMDPALGAPLPRDPRAFLSQFDPNMPQPPTAIDPRNQRDQALPRLWQYPVAWNLPTAPGTYKMVPFRLMRNVIDMSHVGRACIEVRKEEIADVEWEVSPREEERGQFKVFPDKKAGLFDQWRTQRKTLQTFWERPDAVRGLRYDQWIKMAVEEVLVTDSLSIFEHSTWGADTGPLGSDLYALTILDGTTIKPLLDIRGAPPEPPNPAYQQFIWGLPRVDLVSLVLDARDDARVQDSQRGFAFSKAEYLELTRDQLAYLPYHRRAWTAYGFSNVEQCILLINVALKRLDWHNRAFTEGDIPAMLVHLPETWTLDQINKYEAQWHAMLAGDQGWKWRMKAVPGAIEAQELKPDNHDMTFDEYVDRMLCAAMTVDPTEVGMEPKGGLGGSGYMDAQDDRRKRLTVGPMLREFKGYMDDVHVRRFASPELEIRYDGLDVEDEELQHKIDIDRVSKATMTPNEYRRRRGEPPIDGPAADNGNKFWFILGREVVPLDRATDALDQQQQQFDMALQQQKDGQTAGNSTGKPTGDPALPGNKLKAADVDEDEPTSTQKSLEEEIETFDRFLRRPRARKFSSDVLPKSVVDAVYDRLAKGESRKVVLNDLRSAVLQGQEMLASETADALLERLSTQAAGSLQ